MGQLMAPQYLREHIHLLMPHPRPHLNTTAYTEHPKRRLGVLGFRYDKAIRLWYLKPLSDRKQQSPYEQAQVQRIGRETPS